MIDVNHKYNPGDLIITRSGILGLIIKAEERTFEWSWKQISSSGLDYLIHWFGNYFDHFGDEEDEDKYSYYYRVAYIDRVTEFAHKEMFVNIAGETNYEQDNREKD